MIAGNLSSNRQNSESLELFPTTLELTSRVGGSFSSEGDSYSNSTRLPFIQHVASVHAYNHIPTNDGTALTRRQNRTLENFKLTRNNTSTTDLPAFLTRRSTLNIIGVTGGPTNNFSNNSSSDLPLTITKPIPSENNIGLNLTNNSLLLTENNYMSSNLNTEPILDLFNMGKIQEFRDKVSASKVTQKDIWRCLAAEFFGTFILVLVGCGSVVHLKGVDEDGKETGEKPTLLGAALTFGLLVATLAETTGHVSGCHINPAVTIAMLVSGRIQVVKAGLYIIVQCVAAIVGIAVLKALTPGDTSEIGFGYTTLAKDMTELQGFGVEFMITFVLLIIIFAVTDEGRRDIKGSAPLAIGLALTALVLYGGPLTGAGMNPARVLGPCVILGKFESHWLYWVGPIGGAVTAAAVYQGVFRASRPEEIEAVDLALERKSRDREAVKINGAVPPV